MSSLSLIKDRYQEILNFCISPCNDRGSSDSKDREVLPSREVAEKLSLPIQTTSIKRSSAAADAPSAETAPNKQRNNKA